MQVRSLSRDLTASQQALQKQQRLDVADLNHAAYKEVQARCTD